MGKVYSEENSGTNFKTGHYLLREGFKKKKLQNFGHCPNHGGGGLSKAKLFS